MPWNESTVILPTSVRGYIITLDPRGTRMRALREALQHSSIEFQIVDGVDGRGLDQERIKAWTAECAYYRPLLTTEFGCYLSHVTCCERIVAENADMGVVLEDDALVLEPFDRVLAALLDSGADFDIVKLRGRKKGQVVVKVLPVEVPWGGSREGQRSARLVEYHPVPVGMVGQVWSREGAEKFLEFSQHGNRMRRPVDVDLRHPWEHGMTIYSVVPDVVRLFSVESTIGRRYALPRSALRKWVYEASFVARRVTHAVRKHGLRSALTLELGGRI